MRDTWLVLKSCSRKKCRWCSGINRKGEKTFNAYCGSRELSISWAMRLFFLRCETFSLDITQSHSLLSSLFYVGRNYLSIPRFFFCWQFHKLEYKSATVTEYLGSLNILLLLGDAGKLKVTEMWWLSKANDAKKKKSEQNMFPTVPSTSWPHFFHYKTVAIHPLFWFLQVSSLLLIVWAFSMLPITLLLHSY